MCFLPPVPQDKDTVLFFYAAPFSETRCDGRYVFLGGPQLTLEGPGPSSSSPLSPNGGGNRADLSSVP